MSNDETHKSISKHNMIKTKNTSSIVSKVNRDTSESPHIPEKTSARHAPKSVRNPLVLDATSEQILRNYHYEIKEKLGAGAFSDVYCAINHKRPDRNIAVKIIDLSSLNEKYLHKFLPRELQSLKEVQHEYVIKIYDIFRMMNRIFIFMEKATKGDLTKYLRKLHKPMEEPKACKWFYQMCCVLAYMHDFLHIAHRDIKIDNILITEEGNIKLTDLGFSRHVLHGDDNEPEKCSTWCGTRPYLSPQIISKTPYNAFKADVWALAVVLFTMLNNKYIFHYEDRKVMYREHQDKLFIAGRFGSHLSEEAKNLMMAMFEFDEAARIDVAKIFEHNWVVLNFDNSLVIEVPPPAE